MNNPMQIIQSVMSNKSLINSNPMLKNAVGMYQSNDTNGLKQMAENLCRERGMNIDDIRKQLGI